MSKINYYNPKEATIDNTQIIVTEPQDDMRKTTYNELFEMIINTARMHGLTVEMKDEKIMFIKGEPKDEKK